MIVRRTAIVFDARASNGIGFESSSLHALERAGELVRLRSARDRVGDYGTRRSRDEEGGRRESVAHRKTDCVRSVSPFPLAINTLGSVRRMAMSMGASIDAVAELVR